LKKGTPQNLVTAAPRLCQPSSGFGDFPLFYDQDNRIAKTPSTASRLYPLQMPWWSKSPKRSVEDPFGPRNAISLFWARLAACQQRLDMKLNLTLLNL
jgi:hypothetical protein